MLPGLAFVAVLRPQTRDSLLWDERLFLVGATSVASSAWVALFLAELGVFSTLRAAFLLGSLSIAMVVFRRDHVGNPLAGGRWRDGLPALVIVAISFALFARPSEYIVGGRDPGSYVAAMGVIGRTGAISHVDPVIQSIPREDISLFYADATSEPFRFTLDVFEDKPQVSWPRFMGFEVDHPLSGRVTPQFFHLFPAFGAYLFQTMGVRGALATPPIFGVLGALAAFLLGRRLFGLPVAFLGSLLLVTNVLQVWFSRYPASETMSQFLLLSGVFASVTATDLSASGRGRALYALAAAFLGLSCLVRIDSLLAVPVVVCYALIFLRRDRGLTAFLTVFGLLAAHAATHALLFSTRYAHQIVTRRYWNLGVSTWIALVATAGALTFFVARFRTVLVPWFARRGMTLRHLICGVLVVLVAYAMLLRGHLSAWAGGDGNAASLKSAGTLLSILRSLGFHRLAAHDAQAMVRLSWFLGLPLTLLAVAGLLLWVRQARAKDALPLALFLVFAVFYLYKIRVFNDYFFAMRRYIPLTLPFACLLAAFAVHEFYSYRSWWRRFAPLLAAAAFVASFINTWPLLTFQDWKGSVRFVSDIARRFGPKDIVVFEQPRNVHLLSLPLWALHGVQALEFRRFNPDPERLNHLVDAWRGRYDNIYFVNSYRTDVCGLFLERVQPFRFTSLEWEWTYDRVPSKPEPRVVDFAVFRLVRPESLRIPHSLVTDIGSVNDIQISGFYEGEASGDRNYRWTGACLDAKGNAVAAVYLPAMAPGDAIEIVSTSHLRPASAKAPVVTASLDGVSLGTFTPDSKWNAYRVDVPARLSAGSRVVTFSVPAWRPSNTDPSSTDTRDLGIMIDAIRIVPGHGPRP